MSEEKTKIACLEAIYICGIVRGKQWVNELEKIFTGTDLSGDNLLTYANGLVNLSQEFLAYVKAYRGLIEKPADQNDKSCNCCINTKALKEALNIICDFFKEMPTFTVCEGSSKIKTVAFNHIKWEQKIKEAFGEDREK